MNRTLWLLLLATAVVAGCRNLDYPEGDEVENIPPEVSFVLPGEDELVSQSPVIALDARDANGVASVTLLCGGTPVYLWTSPPFTANVPLGGCVGVELGGGRRNLTLTAVAQDVPGMQSAPITRQLTIDTTAVHLWVEGTGRAAPGGGYVARVIASHPLAAPPVVRLGTLSAVVTERADLQTQPLTVFDATFTALPGLPRDANDAGTAPLELSAVVEQSHLIEVQGLSLTGNRAQAVATLRVSQIAWEEDLRLHYQPFSTRPSDARTPVAGADGLMLPFRTWTGTTYLPATLAHEDGRFIPFPAPAARELSEGGFGFAALDAQGRAYFHRGTATPFEYEVRDGLTGEVQGGGTASLLLGEWRRTGDQLCSEELVPQSPCSGTGTRTLECLSPQGSTRSVTVVDVDNLSDYLGSDWVVSGGLYLSYQHFSSCSYEESAVFASEPAGSARIARLLEPGAYRPELILPLSGRRFLVSQVDAFNNPRLYVLNEDLAVEQDFFSAEGLQYLGQSHPPGFEQLLGTRVEDDVLFLLRHHQQQTLIEAWQAQAPAPLATLTLPGWFISAAGYGRPGLHVSTDGSLYLHLASGIMDPLDQGIPFPGRAALIATDDLLRVRWIYRAPHNRPGSFYAHPSEGHLYLVDDDAQRVTAFFR